MARPLRRDRVVNQAKFPVRFETLPPLCRKGLRCHHPLFLPTRLPEDPLFSTSVVDGLRVHYVDEVRGPLGLFSGFIMADRSSSKRTMLRQAQHERMGAFEYVIELADQGT
jgi:hypothetical protein